MAMTRAQFQRFLFPGIREVIFRKFKEFPPEFVQLFNMLSSDSAFEEDVTVAGLGLYVRTPENVEYAEDQFLPGFPKRYQHEDYTLSVGASPQIRRDDKTGFWKERSPDLGFSARQTKEILVADLFNSGFTAVTGPDGKPLFATDHPNIKQGTQSNIMTPAAAVSVIGVRLGLQQFRKYFDDTGVRRRMLMAEWLVHSADEEYNVLEILHSTGRPDTANRADNVVRNAMKEFTWDYLTDSNNWFIMAGKDQHKLKFYNRVDLTVGEYMDDKTDIQYVKARMAFSFGHSHWIGTQGSNPV